MPQAQTMTLDEKFAIGVQSIELEKQGKFAEAEQVLHHAPLMPYMAKFLKDHIGLDALIKSGWNLSEAEAEFGPEFLSL